MYVWSRHYSRLRHYTFYVTPTSLHPSYVIRVLQGHPEPGPEGVPGVLTLEPLDVRGGPQHRQHGAAHVARLRLLQRHQHHDVIALHDAGLTQAELELTPLAAREVRGEDEEDSLALLHAVRDVVHDVLAWDEVAVVNAQLQPPLTL